MRIIINRTKNSNGRVTRYTHFSLWQGMGCLQSPTTKWNNVMGHNTDPSHARDFDTSTGWIWTKFWCILISFPVVFRGVLWYIGALGYFCQSTNLEFSLKHLSCLTIQMEYSKESHGQAALMHRNNYIIHYLHLRKINITREIMIQNMRLHGAYHTTERWFCNIKQNSLIFYCRR